MKVDIDFIKRLILSVIWICRNFLKIRFLLNHKFGVKGTKIQSLFKWHGGAYYFTGNYNRSQVFIKFLDSEFDILQNEVTALRLLSQNSTLAHTPRLFIYGKIGAFDFIVLEFISSKTLEYHLRNDLNEFSTLDKKEIVQQLIHILDDLHKNKVIHRDLRPDNIFISNENGLRLILFDYTFAIDSNNWTGKQRFSEIQKNIHSHKILDALGEEYKPGKQKWDDAYSIYKILKENEHTFKLDDGILEQVRNKIDLEVITNPNSVSVNNI